MRSHEVVGLSLGASGDGGDNLPELDVEFTDPAGETRSRRLGADDVSATSTRW